MAGGGLSEGVATGAVAVLGSGGVIGFVKWVWGKREGTVARLEKRVAALEDELREVWFAFAHVTAALRQNDPANPALRLAAQILKDKFPVDPTIPADMQALVDKIK
jgi:hypothetical protein